VPFDDTLHCIIDVSALLGISLLNQQHGLDRLVTVRLRWEVYLQKINPNFMLSFCQSVRSDWIPTWKSNDPSKMDTCIHPSKWTTWLLVQDEMNNRSRLLLQMPPASHQLVSLTQSVVDACPHSRFLGAWMTAYGSSFLFEHTWLCGNLRMLDAYYSKDSTSFLFPCTNHMSNVRLAKSGLILPSSQASTHTKTF
jgi:hypothetical protein